ncbi:pyrophosphatase PpaX [Gracilibacillus boraciitolerans JCM 21714]|uniref:Pyrophosphatase PpaX n=1 Tax=Gracilibacillus boraciitolerans JCM 21714 TaxID=1298598 RepID=W4VIV9_9BACI|nr:pyrophosphatase PpaX [Gracilibacillus boraciitolerans]GAE92753.1 pyrophosphatase PpaX [Gracilibacillus boraciitolerans JCM 21714]
MKIETILFDLDGTLIDTNELIIASFTHTVEKYGDRPYTREEIMDFIGPPLTDSLKKVNVDNVEEMIATYRKHNYENHEKYVTAFPTVVETIKTLKDKGFQLGIVTTKLTDTAKLGLKITGMDQLFDVLIGLDDVEHAKPHPEPILKAIELLKANPMTTIMVGDNYHDIEAGHNAGVQTAGVAWTIKGRKTLEAHDPNYMLEKMSDLLEIVGVK